MQHLKSSLDIKSEIYKLKLDDCCCDAKLLSDDGVAYIKVHHLLKLETCDLKCLNLVCGIGSCSCTFACPYCVGSKLNEQGRPTNKRGWWDLGELRTARCCC